MILTIYCPHCEAQLKPDVESDLLICPCGRSRVRAKPRQAAAPVWLEPLVEALKRTGGVLSRSCDEAGVARSTVYERMERDPVVGLRIAALIDEKRDSETTVRTMRVVRRLALSA